MSGLGGVRSILYRLFQNILFLSLCRHLQIVARKSCFIRTEKQSREVKQDLRKPMDSYQSIEDFFFQNKAAEQNETKSRKSMFFQNSTAEQRETKTRKTWVSSLGGVRSRGCQVLEVSGLGDVRSWGCQVLGVSGLSFTDFFKILYFCPLIDFFKLFKGLSSYRLFRNISVPSSYRLFQTIPCLSSSRHFQNISFFLLRLFQSIQMSQAWINSRTITSER